MNDWNEMKYNLPQRKFSKAEITAWLRNEINKKDLAEIINEVLCDGDEVWSAVSANVLAVLNER